MRDIAPLPSWIIDCLGATDRTHAVAPEGVQLDSSENEARSRQRLKELVRRGDVAKESEGGNDRTYRLAAEILNLGLTPENATMLILEEWNHHCEPPWDEEELAGIVDNASRYAQNEPGAYGVSSKTTELWNEYAKAHTEEISANPYAGRWPDEYETLPDLVFWDEDKVLPRFPDGCIMMLYGAWGNHKTNVTLSLVLEAVLGQGARAVYAAGEGHFGVGRNRIPAHCARRSIAVKDLRGKFRIVPRMPLFSQPDQVHSFIEAQADIKPDIIVLDTYATAIAGEDENSSRAAAFLTANGAAGWIRQAYNALVILPAHMGKDKSKGIRGNSGIEGNVDVVVSVEADKDAGAIKLTVEKMRDGEDGFSIYFAFERHGVPVPVRISEADYFARVKPALRFASVEQKHAVYKMVYGRLSAGDKVNLVNGGQFGPSEIAYNLREQGIDEKAVKDALTALVANEWLSREKNEGYVIGPKAPGLNELSEETL